MEQNGVNKTTYRLTTIDALRGFACIWVVLHHAFTHGLIPRPDLPKPLQMLVFEYLSIGFRGVNLFLVISGFCLMWPLVKEGAPLQEMRFNALDFYRRRAIRILPPYYVAMVLSLAFVYAPATAKTLSILRPVGGEDILAHVALVHNFSPDTVGTINNVFWSLALECQLYALFPLMLLSIRRWGWSVNLVAALAIAVGWQLVAASFIGSGQPAWKLACPWYNSVPGLGFTFLLGAATAALAGRARQDLAGPLAQACRKWALPVMLVGLLGGLYRDVWLGSAFDAYESHFWALAFAAVMVGSLVGIPVPVSRVPSIVERALAAVGMISYSVYLIHIPLFALWQALARVTGIDAPAGFLWGGVPLILLISTAFWMLVERPFVRSQKKRAIASPALQLP